MTEKQILETRIVLLKQALEQYTDIDEDYDCNIQFISKDALQIDEKMSKVSVLGE